MNTGALNQRVCIEKVSLTQDTTGQPIETWIEHCGAWVNIQAQLKPEAYRDSAGQVVSTVTHIVRMRRNTTLDTSMRLNWRGRYLAIESWEPYDGPQQTLLRCREVQDG